MNEVKITAVRASGEVFKTSMTNTGRPGFGIMVVYTLVDAREVDSRVTATRKKDVLPGVDSNHQAAVAGQLSATFEDGKFWGIRRVYGIGGLIAHQGKL